jgi:hypothetical protein
VGRFSVEVDGGTVSLFHGKGDIGRLGFVSLYSPAFHPLIYLIQVTLKEVKSNDWINMSSENRWVIGVCPSDCQVVGRSSVYSE